MVVPIACTTELEVGVTFESAELESAISELRVFAFDRLRDPTARCEVFDPVGAGPGDAEQRTGRAADRSGVGAMGGDVLLQLEGVPRSKITLVVEAWDRSTQAVLRSYACKTIDTDRADVLPAIALQWLAGAGATIQLTDDAFTGVRRVVDEALAVEPLEVAIRLGEAQAGVEAHPVFWSVVSGNASLSPAGVVTTTVASGRGGETTAFVRAGAGASSGPVIRVIAYAAGFEGGPIEFEIEPRGTVYATVRRVPIPGALAQLQAGMDAAGSADPRGYFRPVVTADFDRDGRVDFATLAGRSSHRIVLAYGEPAGRWAIHVSPERARAPIAMAVFRMSDVGPPGLVVSSAHVSAVRSEDPRLEIWQPPAGRPTAQSDWSVVLTHTPQRIAIDLAAANLDASGPDELAAVRCKRVDSIVGRCVGSAAVDNDLVVMQLRGGDLSVTASTSANLSGGFRSARFADLDADGALDLVAAAGPMTRWYCGDAGTVDLTRAGAVTNPQPDSGTLSVGQFGRDDLADVALSMSVTLSGDFAEVQLYEGCARCVDDPRVTCGLRSLGRPHTAGQVAYGLLLPTAAIDLDGDGVDDSLVLHRREQTLRLYFGGGPDGLVPGPILTLPAADVGGLAAGTDRRGRPTVVTIDPEANAFVVIRFEAP